MTSGRHPASDSAVHLDAIELDIMPSKRGVSTKPGRTGRPSARASASAAAFAPTSATSLAERSSRSTSTGPPDPTAAGRPADAGPRSG
jgi:hypothetical protein